MNEEEVNEMLQNLAFDAVIAGEEGPLVVESEADEETVLNSTNWVKYDSFQNNEGPILF